MAGPERDLASASPYDLPRLRKEDDLPGAGFLGVRLTLAALGIPFVAALIAVLQTLGQPSVQGENLEWRGVPIACWVSTALAIGSSWFAHRSLIAIQNDEVEDAVRSSRWTSWIAMLFLVGQVVGCVEVARMTTSGTTQAIVFRNIFYVLTVYHWIHVVGTLFYQSRVIRSLREGRYFSSYHPGVAYVAEAWHFVDLTWIVVFLTMVVAF